MMAFFAILLIALLGIIVDMIMYSNKDFAQQKEQMYRKDRFDKR